MSWGLEETLADYRDINWGGRGSGSGTAGTVPKTVVIRADGTRWYLKLSSYDVARGVYGLESQNELVASRLFDLFGLPHVRYALQNAVVRLDGREQRAWVAESADFVPKGWSSRFLSRVYERERKEGEEVLRGDAQAVPVDVQWVLRDGRTTMTDMEARRFVEDYVFPPERQNAAGMLRDLGLEEYDSWRIFTIVHRRPLDHCGFRVDEVEVLHDEPDRLDR